MVKVIKWNSKKRDGYISSYIKPKFNGKPELNNYAFIPKKGIQEIEIITTFLDIGKQGKDEHTHDYIEEIYYVIDGEVGIEGRKTPLMRGDIFIFSPEKNSKSEESLHRIKNVGKGIARLITIKRVPSNRSRLFEEDKRPRRTRG